MAAIAASIRNDSLVLQSTAPKTVEANDAGNDNGRDNSEPSIVGFWHIRFLVGGQQIQEAFQIWNVGGTEVHNPNQNPGGGVCLGSWKETGPRTSKLTHRVWNYDATGNFLGTIHVAETITVSRNGRTQAGSFALDFYDPSGNFITEVAGAVIGERVQND